MPRQRIMPGGKVSALERQPKMREAKKILKPFIFEDPIFVECHANEKSKSAALIEPPLS